MSIHRKVTRPNTLFVALIFLAVGITYWKALRLPYIADDWGFAWTFHNTPLGAMVRSILDFRGELVYRPLSHLYELLVYKIFGFNGLPSRLFLLFTHTINSLLVAGITKRLVKKDLIAYASGLIYAVAVAIHLDPLSWAFTGVHDVMGAFFFFLSLWLFLDQHVVSSAVAYLVGILFKEALVVLPLVLGGYYLLSAKDLPSWNGIKRICLTFLPFGIVFGAYIFVKSNGTSPFSLPASHPYVIDFWGKHIFRNLHSYAGWMLQAFFPFGAIKSVTFTFILNDVLLVAMFSFWILVRSRNANAHNQLILLGFFLYWIVVGLLPVLVLVRQEYRYYATYSLPAFIAAALILFDNLLTSLRLSERNKNILFILPILLTLSLSTIQANKIFGEKLKYRTLTDGTNLLIQRAAVVDIVQAGLIKYLPSPPDGSIILLGNVDLWAFDKNTGIRLWYDNNSLNVYPLESLKQDENGIYIQNPIENQLEAWIGPSTNKKYIDPGKSFAYKLTGTKLTPVSLESIFTISNNG